jgi:hypothetical protein
MICSLKVYNLYVLSGQNKAKMINPFNCPIEPPTASRQVQVERLCRLLKRDWHRKLLVSP